MELMAPFGAKDWNDCQRQYRIYLYVKAQQVGLSPDDEKAQGVFTEAEVRKVIAVGGELPVAARLHCRVRHFTRGLVIGSEVWVADVVEKKSRVFRNRARAGPKECLDPVAPGLFSAKHCRMQH